MLQLDFNVHVTTGMITGPQFTTDNDIRCHMNSDNGKINSVLQNACGLIYKISYNNFTMMPKLRSTYDRRVIYKTTYEERKAFLR